MNNSCKLGTYCILFSHICSPTFMCPSIPKLSIFLGMYLLLTLPASSTCFNKALVPQLKRKTSWKVDSVSYTVKSFNISLACPQLFTELTTWLPGKHFLFMVIVSWLSFFFFIQWKANPSQILMFYLLSCTFIFLNWQWGLNPGALHWYTSLVIFSLFWVRVLLSHQVSLVGLKLVIFILSPKELQWQVCITAPGFGPLSFFI